jgi:hypothetical protein
VITPRSPVQGSCAVPEYLCLTRPYVPKARTLPLRPSPPALARSPPRHQPAGPGTTPEWSSTCVAPHPRHRDLRGTSSRPAPPQTRTRRSRAFPHPPGTPPHDGHNSSPPASCRSTTAPSPFTVSTTPPRVNPAALPSSLPNEETGGPQPVTDVITVPPHTKKDNPKAALKPHPQRQRRKPAPTSSS